VGKPGDLGDHPADKISVRFGSETRDQEDLPAGSLDCCVLPLLDCFLMPSYYVPLFV